MKGVVVGEVDELTAALRARWPPRHMPVLPILLVHVGRLRR